jgi:FkbM family methyltransferase
MWLLGRLSVWIARHVPASSKKVIHRNRFLNRLSMAAYGSLLGESPISIRSGPMRGVKLMPSQNISHAHIQGDYEQAVQLIIDQYVDAGDVCYDLGASIGYLSLLMSRKARHVYAFEPAPAASNELLRHLTANRFENVTVVHQPVSDRVRNVRFCLTDAVYGSGINETETRWPVLELESLTLDLFAESHPPPNFLKIDVEGEETRVLEGARHILTKYRPTILCELHSSELAREVSELLISHHYTLCTLRGDSFVAPQNVMAGDVHVLALPSSVESPER